MKALDLYKFIQKNDVEYHWHDDNLEVLMFVDIPDIYDFYKILTSSIFDDSGIECKMKDGYFVFEMLHICSYYDIELKDIFKP